MSIMENRTYDEIQIGESAEVARTVTRADIELFAVVSGDVNPAHLDDAYAATTRFKNVIMHGMWSGAIISSLLGTRLPGPGTIYLSQSLNFRRPVSIGDVITFSVTAKAKQDDKKFVTFDCVGRNQDGKAVVDGEAVVMAPADKLTPTAPAVPPVTLRAVPFDPK